MSYKLLKGYTPVRNPTGGSISTTTFEVGLSGAEILTQLNSGPNAKEFQKSVGRNFRDTVLNPQVTARYRGLITQGLPTVLSHQASGTQDFSSAIRTKDGTSTLLIVHKTWKAHTARYRDTKRYSGIIRHRSGRNVGYLLRTFLNQSGVTGNFVKNLSITNHHVKGHGTSVVVDAKVRIAHTVRRQDYDDMIKDAFSGLTTSRVVLHSWGNTKAIGILNAFETGYGGRSKKYSRVRHRPIIADTARHYGAHLLVNLRKAAQSR